VTRQTLSRLSFLWTLVAGVAHAADPEPPASAECRYALRQAEADPRSEVKARTCRARCAASPSTRARCPKPRPVVPERPPEPPPERPPETPPERPPETPPERPPETPPELPPETPPEAPSSDCHARWLEAVERYARDDVAADASQACVAACDGPDGDVGHLSICMRMARHGGRLALARLIEPLPTALTLEPGSGVPVLVPWLGPFDNGRRALQASGWAVAAGLGGAYRTGAVAGVFHDGAVRAGEGAGGVLEAHGALRGQLPDVRAEIDAGLELRTVSTDLATESGVALERAHFAIVAGGAVGDGFIGEEAHLDVSAAVSARRLAATGVSVRGTPLAFHLGLAWSDLDRAGSGLVAGAVFDGVDYGRYRGNRRTPLGLRVPLFAALGLGDDGATFRAFIALAAAPRYVDAVGLALPVWLTLGGAGCTSASSCADLGVDAGARPFTALAEGEHEGGPFYELPTSVILRARARLRVRLDGRGTLTVSLLADPITVSAPAEEAFKRPHPIPMGMLLADAPLASDAAAYPDGYYHGGYTAALGIDLPALPLTGDLAVTLHPSGDPGFAAGARLPLGPVSLGLRYRATPVVGGDVEHDLMATLGIDQRGSLDRPRD